jgi:hypothetical protein
VCRPLWRVLILRGSSAPLWTYEGIGTMVSDHPTSVHRRLNMMAYHSHLWDCLEDVPCDFPMTKSLPNCEHTAELRCSADPALHPCTAFCGGIMRCCGRDCNSRCHECQCLNTDNQAQPFRRSKYHNHPCQKTLFCQHSCSEMCSQEHQCTTVCKEPCRQQCSHTRCKNYCSTPCAPCQEPCTWSVSSDGKYQS